jgi:hypothetical protein
MPLYSTANSAALVPAVLRSALSQSFSFLGRKWSLYAQCGKHGASPGARTERNRYDDHLQLQVDAVSRHRLLFSPCQPPSGERGIRVLPAIPSTTKPTSSA